MKPCLTLGFTCFLFILLAAPARADLSVMRHLGEDEIQLADATRLNDQDMGELRAGFIDPSGFILKFAVDVKSHIDGALMYVRSLVLHPDSHGRFQAEAKTEILPQNLPEGTKATIVEKGSGIVVSNDAEPLQNTTILNQVANGSFANVILNTANDRNVSQTMNIDLVLHNVKNVMDQVNAAKQFHAPGGLYQMTRLHMLGIGL